MNLGPIVETDGTYIRRVGPEQRVALESRTACEFTSTFLGRDQVNASVLALSRLASHSKSCSKAAMSSSYGRGATPRGIPTELVSVAR